MTCEDDYEANAGTQKPSNDYLMRFSAPDLQLVMDALDYYSRQTMMFGTRAARAALVEQKLIDSKSKQDAS